MFGYSSLEPFVSPSENKPAKSSKYEFCSCVTGKKFVHDENIQSIDVMGLPPPIVNCLTLPGLRKIAEVLNIEHTNRTPISAMRDEILSHKSKGLHVVLRFSPKLNNIRHKKTSPLLAAHVSSHEAHEMTATDVDGLKDMTDTDVPVYEFPPKELGKSVLEQVINGWCSEIMSKMIS